MAEEKAGTHPAVEKGWVAAVAWTRAENVFARIAEKKSLTRAGPPAFRSNVPNAATL